MSLWISLCSLPGLWCCGWDGAALARVVLLLWFFAHQWGAQGKGPRAGTTISITHLQVLLCALLLFALLLCTLHCTDGFPPVICNFLESCQAWPGHLCK